MKLQGNPFLFILTTMEKFELSIIELPMYLVHSQCITIPDTSKAKYCIHCNSGKIFMFDQIPSGSILNKF